MSSERISIKTPEEIAVIRQGGRILAGILKKLAAMVRVGVSTAELEQAAEKMILAAGGRPSFKGYRVKNEKPFPTVICASLNDEIVHAPALPSRILKEGDIIGLDIGMEYPSAKGFFTDTAVTVGVGQISKEAGRLMSATREALKIGVRTVKPGRRISDIGRAIEKVAKKHRLGIVRDLVGHGVGYAVHEAPRIPNYFDAALSHLEIKSGMVLALEPMFTLGGKEIKCGPDGFTCQTADHSLAAHFEHTIVVTERGAEIVT